MQGRYLVGPLVQKAHPQDVGEEVVVAIPPALVVQRDDEQVAALQVLERPLPCFWPVTASHRAAAQRVEDRGLQQEVADALRLAL